MRRHALMGRTLSIFLTLASGLAQAHTCESLFDPIQPTSLEWIRARNSETEAVLMESPNFFAIERTLRASVPAFKIVRALRLGPNRRLQVWRTGFAKPDQLALIEDGKVEMLDWSFHHVQDGTERIHSIVAAPGGNVVALVIEQKGTTDNYEIVIVDILTRKVLFGSMYASKPQVAWLSASELTYQEHTQTAVRVRSIDLRERKWGVFNTHRQLFAAKAGLSLFRDSKTWLLADTRGLRLELPSNLNLDDIVGRIGRIFYLKTKNDNGEILKITQNSNGEAKIRMQVPSTKMRVLDDAQVQGNTMTMHYRWGTRHWLRVLSLDREVEFTIELPFDGSYRGATWNSDQKTLDVLFESPVSKKRKLTYDLEKNSWNRASTESGLYRDSAGIDYVATVVNVRSADGTIIPTQLTHRRDLRPDGKNPALIRAYGGFGKAGYVDAPYDPMMHAYLKSGGILVAPMIRGGGEFGTAWHEAGKGEKKMRAVEDVVATAKWLAENGWSQPRHIDLMGSSNGGFIAAAAGLISPLSFGTIYAFAGVHDMLMRSSLDPKFNRGWNLEYGDETEREKDRIWLEAISPLELARKTDPNTWPRFFILVGRNDTRVNPEHSYRLTKTLLERGVSRGSVLMYDIDDAGHFVAHTNVENPVNWLANTAIWTLISDRANFKFAQPPR